MQENNTVRTAKPKSYPHIGLFITNIDACLLTKRLPLSSTDKLSQHIRWMFKNLPIFPIWVYPVHISRASGHLRGVSRKSSAQTRDAGALFFWFCLRTSGADADLLSPFFSFVLRHRQIRDRQIVLCKMWPVSGWWKVDAGWESKCIFHQRHRL